MLFMKSQIVLIPLILRKPVEERLRLKQLLELRKTDPRCDKLIDRELQGLKEEIYSRYEIWWSRQGAKVEQEE